MRVLPRGIAVLLAAQIFATPALADVKAGVDAWSRGDFARAVAEWQGPAAAGDPDAEFNLAQAYKLGLGVAPDLERAETLYLAAARQGHLQAADNYGLILFQNGRRHEAMAWLVPSAERGEPRAQYVLGIAHFNGDLVPRDPVRAYALMTRAAAAGLATARPALATMDAELPLAERQQGVALAAELEAKANAARGAQLAALDLGEAKPAQHVAAPKAERPPAPAPQAAVPPPVAVTPSAAPTADPSRGFALAIKRNDPQQGAWRVQLGAFGVAGNAQGLWAKLKASAALAGRQPFYVPAGRLTKLQAGPFATRAEAQAACAKLGGQACIPVQP
jgi:cell division septation protein DedD